MADSLVDDDVPSWVTSVLWPGASVDGSWKPGRVRMLALPSRSQMTQLVPWRLTSVAASRHRRSDDRGRTQRAADVARLAMALVAGPFASHVRVGIVPHQPTLVERLGAELGIAIEGVLVMCGPRRANQKPVLLAHDRRGRPVAFVKVGWNGLTRSLIERERRALMALAAVPRRGFAVPAVLGAGTVDGASWLALSPVTVSRQRTPSLGDVMRLASNVAHTTAEQRVTAAESAFVDRLRVASAGLERSSGLVARLIEERGHEAVNVGAGHGDFVPWNILSGEPAPAVWDWERYEQDVPIGFDRLHYVFQRSIQTKRQSVRSSIVDLEREAEVLLPDEPRSSALACVDWYVAHLLCRYERDLSEHYAPRLAGRVDDLWAFVQGRWRAG